MDFLALVDKILKSLMNGSSSRDTDVLIVGGGPTGLVLALWLTRLGVRIRIIDKTAEPGTTSRALGVQARTLELYRQVGLADAVLAGGRKLLAANLWVSGKQAARAVFGETGIGLSPFPFALVYPQDEHERLLIDQLAKLGLQVERRTELIDFEEADGRIRACVNRPDDTQEQCTAAFLAGCDGAHSRVREKLKIGFAGGTYEHLFYVADVDAGGTAVNGELHVALDSSDFLALFPLKREGRARLIGTIHPAQEQRSKDLSWDDVSKRVIQWMRIYVRRVNWFSTYRVHHRVANRFRQGSAFLLGDAAHIHSPVGGQGMNTGIGDAVNLAWKLADVVHGRAGASLLHTYEPERIAFAQRLVATTDRAFTGVTSSSGLARLVRLRLVPLVFPMFFALPVMRRYLFRNVSQIEVNYRESPLSEGKAGAVHGGDRLPWVVLDGETGFDNFKSLESLSWQVHVYGRASQEIEKLCKERDLPLCVFPWSRGMHHSGLLRDALYLVRPDGYVAFADATAGGSSLPSYLDDRSVMLGRGLNG